MRQSTARADRLRLPAVPVVLALVTGCVTAPSLRNDSQPDQSGQGDRTGQAAQADTRGQARTGTLAGTAWRLVAIHAADDTVHRPRDAADYTVSFATDGDLAIRADCNRGTGTWTSEHPWQVRFDALATTVARCPQGSLSERYLDRLRRVRSYALEDGHLFLTTGSEGPIIELEPTAGNAGDA